MDLRRPGFALVDQCLGRQRLPSGNGALPLRRSHKRESAPGVTTARTLSAGAPDRDPHPATASPLRAVHPGSGIHTRRAPREIALSRPERRGQASQHTIAAYRDTFTLLLGFAEQDTGRPLARLSIADLNAPTIGAFLQHLETVRGNTAATRNVRLAAIRSFFRYAALRAPEHAAVIQRVLAIPPTRFDRAIVNYLTTTETDALVAAPDRTSLAREFKLIPSSISIPVLSHL